MCSSYTTPKTEYFSNIREQSLVVMGKPIQQNMALSLHLSFCIVYCGIHNTSIFNFYFSLQLIWYNKLIMRMSAIIKKGIRDLVTIYKEHVMSELSKQEEKMICILMMADI